MTPAPYKIHKFDVIDSTNTRARRMALESAPEWTVVAARAQQQGRGRYRRKWESPSGKGLWFSIILRPEIPLEKVNLINLSAALSVRSFLEKKILREGKQNEGIISLKWPNDVLANQRKICGILLESSTSVNQLDFLIVGIGINVNHLISDFSPAIRQRATSLRLITGRYYDLDELLDEFLQQFYYELNGSLNRNFEGIIPEYEACMLYKGEMITIDLHHQIIKGKLAGLDSNGFLRVKTQTGERLITSGEIWQNGQE
ncbi:MAG: hypothetical protein Kow0042_20390 [Calditrichia bacterium]